MMSDLIQKKDILDYCQANIALADKQINEWLEHTLEYKEQHEQQLYISRARQRKQDMEDVIHFVDGLETEEDWITRAFARRNILPAKDITKLLNEAAEMARVDTDSKYAGASVEDIIRRDAEPITPDVPFAIRLEPDGPLCQYGSFILGSEMEKNNDQKSTKITD